MIIELQFNMPYSLDVDGDFVVRPPLGEEFQVHLVTHIEREPRFPGADSIDNVAIRDDDTNIVSHTKVRASYTIPDTAIDEAKFSKDLGKLALSIANMLVTGARFAHGDYVKDYLYSAARLGPVSFRVPAACGKKGFSGFFNPLMGGISIRQQPRTGSSASLFAAVVASGGELPVSRELYCDARRYLIHENFRMALANLVISFEVELASELARIAGYRGDSVLETEISDATLGALGTGLAKRTLGASFENEKYWGSAFSEAYVWLRGARNKVLHKARMSVSVNGQTREFDNETELTRLFAEYDWLKSEIDSAVSNVLAGKPAR